MSNNQNEHNYTENDVKDHLELYKEGTLKLKTWFIAYGIGGLLLFVNNSDFFIGFSSDIKKGVIRWFLIGLLFQIAITLLNKVSQWGAYRITDYDVYGRKQKLWPSWLYDILAVVSRQFWIDVIVDIATLACFSRATFLLIVNIQ